MRKIQTNWSMSRDGQGTGAYDTQGDTEETWIAQPEEETKRAELIAVLSCLMGHYSQMEPNS